MTDETGNIGLEAALKSYKPLDIKPRICDLYYSVMMNETMERHSRHSALRGRIGRRISRNSDCNRQRAANFVDFIRSDDGATSLLAPGPIPSRRQVRGRSTRQGIIGRIPWVQRHPSTMAYLGVVGFLVALSIVPF